MNVFFARGSLYTKVRSCSENYICLGWILIKLKKIYPLRDVDTQLQVLPVVTFFWLFYS